MGKKPTIRDVARQAGVSVASVSYALNGIDKITTETRQRIMKAIEELDYKPSLTARCLSNGNSKLIGVTLPITEEGDIPGVLLNNPFFGEFISGVEYVTRDRGYDILFSGVESNRQYRDWIQRRRLDGIIMLGAYPRSLFEAIKELGVPIVLTDTYEEYAEEFHRVMLEDEQGSYQAARYLLDMGHDKIGFLTGSITNSRLNKRRYEGYKRALDEAGITPEPELFMEEYVTFEGGYQAGLRMLKEGSCATAVFAAADIMAIGLIRAYLENNRSIPGDLSVIGFDDIKFARYITPGLTTMKQDIVKKGMLCANMILDDILLGEKAAKTVVMETELVIRESVGMLHSQ